MGVSSKLLIYSEVLEGASSRHLKIFLPTSSKKNERQTRSLYPLRMHGVITVTSEQFQIIGEGSRDGGIQTRVVGPG